MNRLIILLALLHMSLAVAQHPTGVMSRRPRVRLLSKAKEPYHRRVRDVENKGRHLAVCYTGGMRTFDHVWQSQRDNLFTPLQNAGYDLTVFFATMNGVEHEKDLWASHRKLVVPMDIRKEVGKAVGAARVKIQVTLDGKRDLALPKDFCERCGNCTDKYRWDQPQRFVAQWKRVRECYHMVQAYERLHAHHFLGMFRMRPDLLFVAPADLSWVDHALANDNNDMIEEPQKELARQFGIVTSPKSASGTSMGDWAAFCRADACSSYFEMYSLFETCRSEQPTEEDPCCNMYGQFYTAAMQMQQWQAAESHHLFPATVVRDTPDLANCQRCKRGNLYENVTVPSVACNRMIETNVGSQLGRVADAATVAVKGRHVKLCYEVATAKGWIAQFTCELDGEVMVDKRCPAKQPLHLYRAPRQR